MLQAYECTLTSYRQQLLLMHLIYARFFVRYNFIAHKSTDVYYAFVTFYDLTCVFISLTRTTTTADNLASLAMIINAAGPK